MEQRTQQKPIRLSVSIEPGSLKKVVDRGRLEEFVDTLSTLAAAHIRAEIVAAVASGGGVSLTAGFDDDDEYGTPPKPWPHHSGVYESAMRQLAVDQILRRR
jgi:hypothetical protein